MLLKHLNLAKIPFKKWWFCRSCIHIDILSIHTFLGNRTHEPLALLIPCFVLSHTFKSHPFDLFHLFCPLLEGMMLYSCQELDNKFLLAIRRSYVARHQISWHLIYFYRTPLTQSSNNQQWQHCFMCVFNRRATEWWYIRRLIKFGASRASLICFVSYGGVQPPPAVWPECSSSPLQ